jgi:hypothetical protein
VIVQGYSQATPYIYGVNFSGQLLWKWKREIDRGFASTFALRPAENDFVVVDVGPEGTSIQSVSIASGVVKTQTKLPWRFAGVESHVEADVSPKNGAVLVTLSNIKSLAGTQLNSIALLNPELTPVFQETSQQEVSASFQRNGDAVVQRGALISVGHFE